MWDCFLLILAMCFVVFTFYLVLTTSLSLFMTNRLLDPRLLMANIYQRHDSSCAWFSPDSLQQALQKPFDLFLWNHIYYLLKPIKMINCLNIYSILRNGSAVWILLTSDVKLFKLGSVKQWDIILINHLKTRNPWLAWVAAGNDISIIITTQRLKVHRSGLRRNI